MSNPSYLLPYADIEWQQDAPASVAYQDIYWHRNQALDEKQYVFVDAMHRQMESARSPGSGHSQYTVGELGFGFGINCLLTARAWLEQPRTRQLNFISIEKHPVAPADLQRLLADYDFPHAGALIAQYPPAYRGAHVIWLASNIRLLLIFDDAEHALRDLDARVDHWYLDGFAPARNPDMWQSGLLDRIHALSRPGARVSTYSAAGMVRRNLQSAGFQVTRKAGFGDKREMLSAHRAGDWTPATHEAGNVSIIGGGMAGLYCAEALIRRGQPCRVFASSTGASAIPQLAVFPQLALQAEARYRFSLLASQYMSTSAGYHAAALHWTPRDDDERDRLMAIAALFSNDIIESHPDNTVTYHRAGWLCVEELKAALGIDIEAAHIERLEPQASGWHCLTGGVNVASADQVIIATGAGRDLLAPSFLEPETGIRRIRGQAVSIETTGIDSILNGQVTVFPTVDGHSLISGTYERTSDPVIRETDTRHLVETARQLYGVAADEATAHVGIRAVSRDRLPLVGPVPDWPLLTGVNRLSAIRHFIPGLHYCTAFGSRGATHARLCAEHLVSSMLGEPTALGLAHQQMLSVARFVVRDQSRQQH